MNSLERATKVLRGEVPDRVPVALHCYLMACRMHGGRFDEILRDGAMMAEAQLGLWKEFGHDVIMLEIGVCAAAESLWGFDSLYARRPPHVEEPLIKKLDDLEKLRVPDPERTFPLNQLLRTTRLVHQRDARQGMINGRSDQGPIALALALTGPGTFFDDAHGFRLRSMVPQTLGVVQPSEHCDWGSTASRGAHSSTIGLAGASLISPHLFERFELPGAKADCAALKRNGGFAFVHACGHELVMLEHLIATGADCLELDPETHPVKCKQVVQAERVCLE